MMALLNQIARFIVVGCLATALHYSVLGILVHASVVSPVSASGVGFACGAVLNYWLSHRYTFKSTQVHTTAIPRFTLSALAGLLINQAVLGMVINWAGTHFLVAQVLATGAVMVWNFILGRMWAFGGNGQLKHES